MTVTEAPPFRRDRLVHAWAVVSGHFAGRRLRLVRGVRVDRGHDHRPGDRRVDPRRRHHPAALTALYGGALADRYDARRVVVLANAGRIALLVVGTALATANGVTVPLLLAVAIVFGVLDAIHNPAAMTLPRSWSAPTTSQRRRG